MELFDIFSYASKLYVRSRPPNNSYYYDYLCFLRFFDEFGLTSQFLRFRNSYIERNVVK